MEWRRDLALRDQQDLMALNLFSLDGGRTRPLIVARRGIRIRVSCAPGYAIATAHAKDIIMWSISMLREARDRGQPTSPKFEGVSAGRLLRWLGRGQSGQDYANLDAQLRSLARTHVELTIGDARWSDFTWIADATIDYERGRAHSLNWTLNAWSYAAALDPRKVLTVERGYFDIRRPLVRFLYLYARKIAYYECAGRAVKVDELYDRSGSVAPRRRFGFELRRVVAAQHVPEFFFVMGGKKAEMLHVTRRSLLAVDHPAYELPRQVHRRVLCGGPSNG